MTSSNRPDVTFHTGQLRFSVRCSVFLRNDQGELLVQKKKTDNDASWALPGGRLKVGESVLEGARREIEEEFGVQTFNHRFLGVVEQNITLGEQRIHEHNYLFIAEFAGEILLCDQTLDWKWLDPAAMDAIKPSGCAGLLHGRSQMISNGFTGLTS
ncbi:NUDIX hydrolase [Pseudomonas rubra]|uniref:NUDIX hydrolase n=1 Tax=Pseudomonas rubra TaxID=2942627 RepID=A0ABT5P2U8_9PSED|nr:NUDIX hydrolase [Pseudomonas rubra]MDD1012586.1 NUDIX hydrolase [Pseudomonas rubra]MDD1041411.1 NUDIX hydrolase [Pseudomonas rubra]MDD1153824.1 NUDIX hydrolase [Pseudomonas rubra]